MGILASKNVEHGDIEALFTIDEETGMTGVIELSPTILKGDILINLDSEEEGEICIGCAGGLNASATFNFNTEPIIEGIKAFKICISGLKGGHSGLDINLGRGNANKIVNNLLLKVLREADVRLAAFNGGNMRNAIPREAEAVVVVPLEKIETFYNLVAETEAQLKEGLANIDPGLQITLSDAPMPQIVISLDDTKRILNAIEECPNGATRMLDDMPHIVETSTNMSIVRTVDNKLTITFLLRSANDAAKESLATQMQAVIEKWGGEIDFSGGYPGWKPNVDSAILKTIVKVYQDEFKKEPVVSVMHAGLETALLGEKYTNLDMISFGPTIKNPHSPDEKVHIESVGKFWQLLVEVLKNAPEKTAV